MPATLAVFTSSNCETRPYAPTKCVSTLFQIFLYAPFRVKKVGPGYEGANRIFRKRDSTVNQLVRNEDERGSRIFFKKSYSVNCIALKFLRSRECLKKFFRYSKVIGLLSILSSSYWVFRVLDLSCSYMYSPFNGSSFVQYRFNLPYRYRCKVFCNVLRKLIWKFDFQRDFQTFKHYRGGLFRKGSEYHIINRVADNNQIANSSTITAQK